MILVYFVLQNGIPVGPTTVLETIDQYTCKYEQQVVDAANTVNRQYNTGKEFVAWCEPVTAYSNR